MLIPTHHLFSIKGTLIRNDHALFETNVVAASLFRRNVLLFTTCAFCPPAKLYDAPTIEISLPHIIVE